MNGDTYWCGRGDSDGNKILSGQFISGRNADFGILRDGLAEQAGEFSTRTFFIELLGSISPAAIVIGVALGRDKALGQG